MKILHLIDSLSSGGKERQLVEVLKFFSRQNEIYCHLVVMSDDIHYTYLDDLGIKIYKVLRKSKKDISVFLTLYRIAKELNPKIIHSWSSMCSVYALPAVKILGIKFVNGFLRNAPPNLKVTDKEWIRAKLTFPFSDIIAANSIAGLKTYKVPANKSVCLHNGFDFARIEGLDAIETVRKRFDIKTRHVVGMVATFSENKDYKTFIDAAQLVLEKRKDVTFMAIGDGDYFEAIKKRIKPEFLDNFRFPGKQKRVLNIVNTFDIGVLTTFTEGISNSIMEYMALKKPVITTDCGGNRELVEDERTGFLVKPESPLQIADKILLLMKNKVLAEKLGQNGYEKLKNEFNLENMGKNFLQLYNRLLM